MELTYRRACEDDALCLSVLATQVFLDTYATRGVNADLANEARAVYSLDAFAHRLASPGTDIIVALHLDHLVGLVDLTSTTVCPMAGFQGHEIVRLYVQSPFQRLGIGRALMRMAEQLATAAKSDAVWLTAWSGNARALVFYPSLGYAEVGVTQYLIAGKAYENRVFAKRLASC